MTHVDRVGAAADDHRGGEPRLAAILRRYAARTGVPVLCNTSANLPGRGLFPDVRSATQWGEADFVWSDGVLYSSERGQSLAPPSIPA